MMRLIVAIDRARGLAKNGGMPWSIPDDEKYFTDMTKTHGGHVLTGGKTFREAYKSRPLKDRHNYILTHQDDPIEDADIIHDLPKFLNEFKHDLWVAGGAEVFNLVMALGKADELYITHVDADFGCDQFFPEYNHNFTQVEQGEPQEQNGFRFVYTKYVPRDRAT